MATASKRLRFEVLRRDNYTCRYCGATAPDVPLRVDAVVPEALGGSHKDPANLITACEPCNTGKASTTLDAPVVADVADNALRWAAAIRKAADDMLSDRSRRQASQTAFVEAWDTWGYGEGENRRTIPLQAGWTDTVDQFLAAGLPLDVLIDCISLAMRRDRVSRSDKFRYMCGVAWRKVGELQVKAKQITSGDSAPGSADPASPPDDQDVGRGEFARELLDEVSAEERDYYLGQADMSDYQDEADEPQTADQQACEAVSYLLSSVRCDWDYLARRVEEFLEGLPDGVGERALACPQDHLAEVSGPVGRRTFRLTDALYVAEDLLRLPAARAYLEQLTEAEQSEWRAYAAALYDRAHLDDDRLTSRAAHCAQVIEDGRRWDVMCTCVGNAIRMCPNRGTFYVRVAEADCCRNEDASVHKGHLVCERHLDEFVSGAYTGLNERTFTATDYVAADTAAWDF